MKFIGIFIFVLFSLVCQSQTNFVFVNGAWGIDKCENEICGDQDNPAEFWLDGENASFCLVQDGEHISKSFTFQEDSFPLGLGEFQNVYTTYENYTVFMSGYNNGTKTILIEVKFYFDGFLIGVLNYPIVN